MPRGRSDTPFRRQRFLHRGTSLSSTRFPWVHRTDMACGRTSWTLGLPLRIHPLQLHPASATNPELVRRSAFDRSGPDEGGGRAVNPGGLVVGAYVVWNSCIQVSKHFFALTRWFPRLRSQQRRIRTVRSVNGLIPASAFRRSPHCSQERFPDNWGRARITDEPNRPGRTRLRPISLPVGKTRSLYPIALRELTPLWFENSLVCRTQLLGP